MREVLIGAGLTFRYIVVAVPYLTARVRVVDRTLKYAGTPTVPTLTLRYLDVLSLGDPKPGGLLYLEDAAVRCPVGVVYLAANLLTLLVRDHVPLAWAADCAAHLATV